MLVLLIDLFINHGSIHDRIVKNLYMSIKVQQTSFLFPGEAYLNISIKVSAPTSICVYRTGSTVKI